MDESRMNTAGKDAGFRAPDDAPWKGDTEVESFLSRLASMAGLGAALFAAALGAWQDLPVLPLVLRCAVAGGLVYAFARVAGGVVAKTLLRGLAEHQLKQEEERHAALAEQKAERERKAA